jgi:hypothetical protein
MLVLAVVVFFLITKPERNLVAKIETDYTRLHEITSHEEAAAIKERIMDRLEGGGKVVEWKDLTFTENDLTRIVRAVALVEASLKLYESLNAPDCAKASKAYGTAYDLQAVYRFDAIEGEVHKAFIHRLKLCTDVQF